MSGEMKRLRDKLDAITKDHVDFGLKVIVDKPVPRPETCSTPSELQIIGRDDDLEAIVGMLLPSSDDPSPDQNVCFISIVGMGGLGKTALAQLVYNDKRIEDAFSPRIWVCVSDSEHLSPKEVLTKILQKEVFNLEAAKTEVRDLLQQKKFLLVLDDVWNENHEEWRNLKPFLVSDVSGSRIIVTSRSEKVAKSIGDAKYLHKLQGLSEDNSWRLFKRVAFETETEDELDQGLVSVAKDIVKKCVNVPLCIRVIASLLYDHPKNKWESFKGINLSADRHGVEGAENSIMPTLRFSYYQLTPELKSCFSFCSLFPKDHKIEKDMLIHLWMAEGYLAPTSSIQSLEDVGDQYVNILLNRCFFQDIQLDKYGDVCSFKMHDLMHDLALDVAGKECLSNNTLANDDQLGHKVRHLSTTNWDRSNLSWTNKLRTYISQPKYVSAEKARELEASSLDEVTSIISKCKRLRVLSLPRSYLSCNLPKSLGKLLHLRFLDLSRNCFELLPESITELRNLQILKLYGCGNLKELPENLSKLVNLRALDTSGCRSLSYMPRGMNNLKKLHTLTEFVLGGTDSKQTQQTQGSKLGDLQALTSLKGYLCIRLLDFSSCNMPHAASRAFVLKNARLKKLIIDFEKTTCDQRQVYERIAEGLCPNDDIIHFKIRGYEGTKLPSWESMSDMSGLQHVTSLCRFGLLKVLELYRLKNVEYIEVASEGWKSNTILFFPVLEELELDTLPELKGWWRGLRWREMEGGEGGGGGCLVEVDANGGDIIHAASTLPCFPRLNELTIEDCKSMTYFPPCPNLKKLQLRKVNEALTFFMKGGRGASPSNNVPTSMCLDKLEVYDARVMNSILGEFVGGAVDIQLWFDEEMRSMGIVREAFGRLCWKLKHLSIGFCRELDMGDEEEEMPWKYLQSLSSLYLSYLPKMVKLPKGLQYLTSLQSLTIRGCNNLEEVGECIGFLTSLQTLRIESCCNLKAISECIGFLTALQSLRIADCKGIKSLPESMCHLTSLTTLDLTFTSNELIERCRHPDGEDWPKIRHVPTFLIL